MLSVIFPIYNEEKNVRPLVGELVDALTSLPLPGSYELIAVDDGSNDATFDELRRLASGNQRLKVVRFARNFGQTAALAAGIRRASGDIIVTIDSDLENDPRDIGRLLSLVQKGYDLVCGWRQERWQGAWFRRTLSLVANWLISVLSGVRLHDYGCTLKAYRREVIADLPLYGEMHRFIPIYVHQHGATFTEVPVAFRPRRFGKSKYGVGRMFRVLLDLVFIKFMLSYLTRPIHFFGGVGLVCLFVGGFAGTAAVVLKIWYRLSFVRTPLPILSALFIIVGVQLMVMGILAEVLMRTYYESQGKAPYKIKETLNFK